MRLNLTGESSVEAWFWRLLLGPAVLLDGLATTLTGGTVFLGMSLAASKRLGKARGWGKMFD